MDGAAQPDDRAGSRQGPPERRPGKRWLPSGAVGVARWCDQPDVPTGRAGRHDRHMTRQRSHRRAPEAARVEVDHPEQTTTRLGLAPDDLGPELAVADVGSLARSIGGLQAQAGNAALGRILGGTGHATGFGMGKGAVTTHATRLTVSRDVEEPGPAGPSDELVPLDAGAPASVTETVGPVSESSYEVSASSLADVAAVIGGRPEAGHVGWVPSLDFHQTDGTIDSVTIDVSIDLQMPSWTPPSTMLPKARAEWARWHAALRAHEQGHIDLVHQVFDGLAARLLGTSVARGQRLFANAKTSLAAKSGGYDGRTGHGTKQGTVMNVAIEQQELDEERRKREEGEKTGKREPAVPTVGDEEE